MGRCYAQLLPYMGKSCDGSMAPPEAGMCDRITVAHHEPISLCQHTLRRHDITTHAPTTGTGIDHGKAHGQSWTYRCPFCASTANTLARRLSNNHAVNAACTGCKQGTHSTNKHRLLINIVTPLE